MAAVEFAYSGKDINSDESRNTQQGIVSYNLCWTPKDIAEDPHYQARGGGSGYKDA